MLMNSFRFFHYPIFPYKCKYSKMLSIPVMVTPSRMRPENDSSPGLGSRLGTSSPGHRCPQDLRSSSGLGFGRCNTHSAVSTFLADSYIIESRNLHAEDPAPHVEPHEPFSTGPFHRQPGSR